MFPTLAIVSLVLAQNQTDPQYVGNCLTQRINFTDPQRIFALDGLPSMNEIKELDTGRYDMTIDYFTKQVKFVRPTGVELTISASKNPDANPDAPRLSTTRFMLYGKVTAVLRAPAVPGVVTTFITMGPHLPDTIDLSKTDKQGGDEIDWELLGNDPTNAQSNIFYRGFREFSVRGGYHKLKTDITTPHKYTIDWRRDQIIFSIDDVIQRRYLKNSTQANSKEAPGRRFYPDRAQKVQVALWSDKNNEWAGGSPKWPDSSQSAAAYYEYIDIQCYDDKDQPVPKWPLDNNPDFKPTIPNQPIRGVNGKIPAAAGPNFKGNIKPDGTSFNPTGSASTFGFSALVISTLAYLFA